MFNPDIQIASHVVRASAVLTGSFVAGTVLSADTHNTIGLLVDYTKGDETTMDLKIEVSMDGTNYYQQVEENASTGVITTTLAVHRFAATGAYAIIISPTRGKFYKVSVKANAGTPTGTAAIKAIPAWV